jgi:hypothetical protein
VLQRLGDFMAHNYATLSYLTHAAVEGSQGAARYLPGRC